MAFGSCFNNNPAVRIPGVGEPWQYVKWVIPRFSGFWFCPGLAPPGPSVRRPAPAPGAQGFPSNRLANISDLKANEPFRGRLSGRRRPRRAAQARQAVPGGVGPDGDIVGFSTICPHKGFPLSYNAADKTLNCPGHYSRFDCESGGQQVWGHATQNLPQYTLRVDDKGDIYAEGVDELLYGRLSNVL